MDDEKWKRYERACRSDAPETMDSPERLRMKSTLVYYCIHCGKPIVPHGPLWVHAIKMDADACGKKAKPERRSEHE